jgi:HEAT repeat protein
MKTLAKFILVTAVLLLSTPSIAQSDVGEVSDVSEELKLAALEALIAAPADKALPLVSKVLEGKHSNEVKERALFILSQIDASEAQATLLRIAREGEGELGVEAVRMIGIGGNDESLANLTSIYESGDSEMREAVLEAYMIADDKRSVFNIAVTADGRDFEEAIDMLAVMGALEELRELRGKTGASEALINAYAISGDFQSLREMALDGSNVELQTQAIAAMGIVGGQQVDTTLVEIYRNASSEDIRESALRGMLISGYDAGILELYRASEDPSEKKELLEMLVMTGSDEVWNIIDSALEGDQ